MTETAVVPMGQRADIRKVVWPTEEPDVAPPTRDEPPRWPATPATAPAPAAASRAGEGQPDLPEGSTHAYIWHHAAEAAAVLRAWIWAPEGGLDEGPLSHLTLRQVLAAVLAGLGPEVAPAVVTHLDQDGEGEYVAEALAQEPRATHTVAMHALEAVRQRIIAGEYLMDGGPEFARQILIKAYRPHGPARVGSLLQVVSHRTGAGFAWLSDAAPDQVAPFLAHEHPQTVALILSQIPPAQAGQILARLTTRLQADVSYRIATLGEVSPVILATVEEALEHSLADVLGSSQDVGGPKVLADMLNMTGSSIERNVLDQMDAQDPAVAESVRNLMFTFADISKLTDREVQTLLRTVDQKDLVISLKAAEEDLVDKILGNMSEKVRTFITEEMEFLGPMRLSEVEEVQLRIVKQVRQLEEQGQLTIVRGDADDRFV